ncbi:cysteine--tRNA ligase [candidate division KSB3 bacterium]|uniref:Cysteine--tRNA ligase n=1 Tax=candidate division KSB3 bacterium TaxID=2044937 RepID=A0A2G6E4Z0_9BACT|nr:MAG: cysteine--tRNA ligase [candidate division KSB3 bacterium]PIE29501.1 MAG: cysteine--tRNA ligase [candidate division KSB3 bacterium]
MTLRLYDTYSRSIREFEPLNPVEVGLYTCGPTVYNYAHIGNLRTYLFEDGLRRVLEFNGYNVKHVTNITDVGHLVSDADEGEDKMEKGSRRAGKSAWEIAEIYTSAFKADLVQLNILEPTVWCRATDHIDEQIRVIQMIEYNGFTYRSSDGLYFDTSKLENYGYLARLDIEGLQAGSRVDIGEKRNPTDFALWKFSPEGAQRQMEWESPWGVGFPGWHIECSAMSAKYLGQFFDIHCGGEDHISVHHNNEIAQTQACYGTNLANFWMHGYFLQLNNEKMAKSSDEFLRLQTLLDRGYDPLAYRYLNLTAHYRSHLTFSWEAMDAASRALERLRVIAYDWGAPGELDEEWLETFTTFVNNDLNIPRALAVCWDLAKSALSNSVKKATLCKFDEVLGLRLAEWEPAEESIPEQILALAKQRQHARSEKRWQEADDLRDRIIAAGYEIKDTPHGPKLRVKSRE